MSKKPLFWEMFLFVVCMGALNAVALYFFLYWKIKEFDSLVHFVAGVAVSLSILWLYFCSSLFNPAKRNFKDFIFISIFGIIAVGVFWEIFELATGVTSVTDFEYYYDTILDLVMDTLGALVGCLYGYSKELEIKKSQIENNE